MVEEEEKKQKWLKKKKKKTEMVEEEEKKTEMVEEEEKNRKRELTKQDAFFYVPNLNQGDRIGRIFVSWVLFLHFFKITEVAQSLGLHFLQKKVSTN
jgi:hypothetical protein